MVGKGKRKQPSRAGAATRASKRVKAEERGVERSVEVWPGRSVWQEPPHPVLETILDHLLAQPCGKRWVRVASHVCSYWRAAAQDVLLADTAVSKPEKPPMPEAPSEAYTKPTDTVQTQAAVVLEASNSTGFEAVSKQHADDPPPSWRGGLGFQVLPSYQMRAGGQGYASRRPAPRLPRARRAHAAAPGAAAAGAAVAAGMAAAAAAAAAPGQHFAHQPAAAAGGQQGSIESGMAMRQAPMSDSESDGSTGARQPPPQLRGRSSSRGGSLPVAGRPRTRGDYRLLQVEAGGQQMAAAEGAGTGLGAGLEEGSAPGSHRRRRMASRRHRIAGAATEREQRQEWQEAGGKEVAQQGQQQEQQPRWTRHSLRSHGTPAGGAEEAALGPSREPSGGRLRQQQQQQQGQGQGEPHRRRMRHSQADSDVAAMVMAGSDSDSDVEMPARQVEAQQQQQQEQQQQEQQQQQAGSGRSQRRRQQLQQVREGAQQQQQQQQEQQQDIDAQHAEAAQAGGIGRLPRMIAGLLSSFARPRWAGQ